MKTLKRLRRYRTILAHCRYGGRSRDKLLALYLILYSTLDPRRPIVDRLYRRMNALAVDGQVELKMRRFGRLLSFSMRQGNSADYNIGSEFVMQQYSIEPGGRYDLIVDGGANIGMFAIQAASAFPDARVVAYEPNPDNIGQLKRNVEQNGVAVTIKQMALWSSETTVYFSAHTSMSGRVGTCSTATPVQAVVPEIAPRTWLKLDIEGAEYELLPPLLTREPLPERIDMEIHDYNVRGRSLCQQLEEAGFKVLGDTDTNQPCTFIEAHLKTRAS